MEADQISDWGETAEIDLTSETKSAKKITTFYFVKYHIYEGIESNNIIENANLEIHKKKEEIESYHKKLQWYREEEKRAKWELEVKASYRHYYARTIDQKREYLFHARNALDTKSTYNTVAMQSPEVKELTKHIRGLKHRVQRERLTLKDEKQLIKLMKELKGEKDEVVPVVSSDNKKRQDVVVKQCLSYDYRKLPMEKWPQAITEEIDKLKANQINDRKRMRYLTHYLKEIDNHITCLVLKMDAATSERNMRIELRREYKELADILNTCYYKSHGTINSAKNLAAMKEIAALVELSNSELEKFFSQWSDNEIFRNEYNRRIIKSLDSRGLSKDGRIRRLYESPIVQVGSIPLHTPVFK